MTETFMNATAPGITKLEVEEKIHLTGVLQA